MGNASTWQTWTQTAANVADVDTLIFFWLQLLASQQQLELARASNWTQQFFELVRHLDERRDEREQVSPGDRIMPKLRFNIASLVGVIVILGVSFAALRESSDIWERSVFTLILGVLLIAILLAVHRTESRRAFWIGFALFGWIYLGLSLVPSIESRLIATKGLAYLHSKLSERSLKINTVRHSGSWSFAHRKQVQNLSNNSAGDDGIVVGHEVWLFDSTNGRLRNAWSGTTENFVRIGHSLFALLAAWLGGQLSRRLYRSSRSQEPIGAVEA
jgi:hypothetical protein